MIRAMFSVMAVLLSAAPAIAEQPPAPVCANPDVLDFVSYKLRQLNIYTRIDRRTVSEAQAGGRNAVRCEVYASDYAYDADHGGMTPILHYRAHGYVVRALTSGFVVQSVD